MNAPAGNLCDHDCRRRDGRFVCLKCRAEYVIDLGGSRWVERPHLKRRAEARATKRAGSSLIDHRFGTHELATFTLLQGRS